MCRAPRSDDAAANWFIGPINVGCDFASVTFPLASVDLSLDAFDRTPWQSSEDPEADEIEGEADEDDLDDDEDVQVADYEGVHHTQLVAGRHVGYWRDVIILGALVHITVWERHDSFEQQVAAQWLTEPTVRGGEGGHRWWGRVSFNPSRLHEPDGWKVCPAEDAQMWIVAVVMSLARNGIVVPLCDHVDNHPGGLAVDVSYKMGETGPQVAGIRPLAGNRTWCHDYLCMLEAVSVTRLDATVDFLKVLAIRLWIAVVMAHPQHAAYRKRKHSPLSASVQRGCKGQRVALYAKYAESVDKRRTRAARAPKGTLRVEVRTHTPKLKKRMHLDSVWVSRGEDGSERRTPYSSRKLALLTPDLLKDLFMEGFQWAGIDGWIGGQDPLTPDDRGDLKQTTADRLVQFMDDLEARRTPKGSPNTVRKYMKLVRLFGYVPGVARADVTGPLRCLDPVTGMEQRPSLEWRLARGLIGQRGAGRTLRTVLPRRARQFGREPLALTARRHP